MYTKRRLIIAGAIAFIVFDVAILVHQIQLNGQRQAAIKAQTASLGSTNIPSSKKPSAKDVASYTVPAKYPKYIIIPKLKIKARVVQLNLGKQNDIQSPNNIYDAGWYTGSSLPGQPGAMFIDGHVASWTANGIFYNLKNLQAGDSIQIVRGDNTSYTYKVVKLQTYPVTSVNMTQALAPVQRGVPGLNIMTCAGSVVNGYYNERLVVYASLAS
jgi:sortase (surface protein transpeptidase)